VLLLSFPAAFMIFVANTVPATRYLNPVLPFIAVYAGVGVSALAEAAGSRRWWVAAAVCLIAAAPGAWMSTSGGVFFRQIDTRTIARRHIEAHVPPGTTVALQPNSVPLVQSRESLVEALRANLGDERRASAKSSVRLKLHPYPSPAYRTIFIGSGGLDADKIYVRYDELGGDAGLARLRQLGVTYVVLTRYNRPHPDTVPFLQSLAAEARLVAVFSPFRAGVDAGTVATTQPFLHNSAARISSVLERPGPRLELWKVDAGAR
jgi:Spy/CpxP family protein refolding chaperone